MPDSSRSRNNTNSNNVINDDKRRKLMRNSSKSASARSISRKNEDNISKSRSCRNLMRSSPDDYLTSDTESLTSECTSDINQDEDEQISKSSCIDDNLRFFGIDFNLSGETYNLSTASSPSTSIMFDPRRWSAAVVPNNTDKTINVSYIAPQQSQKSKKLKKKKSNQKDTDPTSATIDTNNNRCRSNGGGPKFVPPKSNDFVPPCSYIPELPRFSFLDRLSEEVVYLKINSSAGKSKREYANQSSSRRRSIAA